MEFRVQAGFLAALLGVGVGTVALAAGHVEFAQAVGRADLLVVVPDTVAAVVDDRPAGGRPGLKVLAQQRRATDEGVDCCRKDRLTRRVRRAPLRLTVP